MKILQVISSFPPATAYGGAARVAFELSRNLVMRGHQVTVFTTDVYSPSSRLKYRANPMWTEGIEVYHFRNIGACPPISVARFDAAPGMAKEFRKKLSEYDLIHLHEYRSLQAILVHHYSTKLKVPYLLQAHGSVLPVFDRIRTKKVYDVLVGRKMLQDAHAIIALTEAESAQYVQASAPRSKVRIIPNGIALTEPPKRERSSRLRLMNNIAEDKKVVLYLGRLHRRKGIDFLIKAFHALLQETDDVALMIAGPDDGYREELLRLVDSLGISRSVRFAGVVDNVDDAYAMADLLVYPGILEIFGLVPFEAIMAGIPVIVTDDCGCGEIIREARCGYLVKFGDEKTLKDTMRMILQNPDEASELVERGRNYILEKLNWSRVAMLMERVYAECVGQSHS